MPRSLLNIQERMETWRAGVEAFNSGRFWDAHEAWERGWLTLPELERKHVQSLIQLSACLHLIQIGRASAARALANTALGKQREIELSGGVKNLFPRICVDGFEAALEKIRKSDESELTGWARTVSLRAKLLLSPP